MQQINLIGVVRDNIKWLFFDIGSTLVDESKCIEQRCRTITSENNINELEFFKTCKRELPTLESRAKVILDWLIKNNYLK